MEVLRKFKFSNLVLNEFCKLFNLKMEQSKDYFVDYEEYYNDISLDETSLSVFVVNLEKIDQFMRVEEVRANALLESYEILFENAIALNSSELYFDVLYSILHGLVSKIKSIARSKFSQVDWFINKNFIADFKSPCEGSCFFTILW